MKKSAKTKRFPYARLVLPSTLLLLLFGCIMPGNRLPPEALEPGIIGHYVIEARIMASSDDAEESATGGVSRMDAALELVRNGNDQTVGLRFAGLNLPRGATITQATLQFRSRTATSETTLLTIQGQAADDAPTFNGTAFNISSRPRTTAAVAWSPAAWSSGAAGAAQRTPDLAPLIQEIINRANWSSGNALALIISGSGRRLAWSFDSDPGSAAVLRIAYSIVETPPNVESFTVTPAQIDMNETVTFAWTVSDPEDDPLSCTLDVDGDGYADYSYSDCRAVSSQQHTYTVRGNYTATLRADDIEGATVTAHTELEVIDPSLVTLSFRIASSNDDAEESATGGVSRMDAALELVRNSSDQTVGLRFAGVNIPRGATITHAYLQFKARSSNSESTLLTLHAQAAANPSSFTGTSFSISSRALGGAAVAWSPLTWIAGEAGLAQRSPDLTALVQEVVDRPDWSSGNALAFVITGSGRRVAWSFDGDAASAPLLYVEYSTLEVPPSVDQFSINPGSVEVGQSVLFSWLVSDPKRDPLSCTLDVNGDGIAEYTIPDCRSTSSQSHTYTSAGRHWVTLTVTDSAHATDTVTRSVHVTKGASATLVSAADIACDPADRAFNGGAGTVDKCRMRYTSDLVLALQPDAVLTPGDHQYQDAVFEKFLQSYHPTWGRFRNITYPALGTHEYHNGNVAGYFDYFGAAAGNPTEGYYSFDLGQWHVVVLNSGCPHIGGCGRGSQQETWLRADLRANRQTCTLALIHYPRFSSGTKGNQTSVTALWQALYDAGADIVISGNDHVYERFAPQDPQGNLDTARGIRQFLVGAGGKSLHAFGTIQPNSEARLNSSYGVLKLNLHPTSYEWAFITESGQTLDSGTGLCQ